MEGDYRSPFQWEAASLFMIPKITIQTWWLKRDNEKLKKVVDHIVSWDHLEKELYARFREARRLKKPVTPGWLRRMS
ncbi:hypothetical protein E4U19_007576 [Claviceps sp. Clav32 group G5]|nr:hypothetical protein E4U19_007576 [Claviceps sp. Clav32 group G5]KAG6033915.1 hypothetical protein E4U40_004683 [Claviceps sp. LM458 group G5]KAG6041687.1 hypothetical protein E4U39_006407 [Claviceps sp. Clav50 group G5]